MIPQSLTVNTVQSWQQQLSHAIKDAEQLLAMLGLEGQLQAIDKDQIKQFPLRVPLSYVQKMRYGDATDPLLKQVFPLIDEGYASEDFVTDPVGDHLAVRSPGMLQKYQGRALLVTTGACAIHCRYCFRRHFPYSTSNPLSSHWQQTFDELKSDTSITEVILSGGDPLSLTDDKLANIIDDLATIPHMKRLRIHTRLPLVLPDRITPELLTWLQKTRFKVIMVIHANHANEIDAATTKVLEKLRNTGCQLLNQSVLLKGVNDSEHALFELSEKLNEVDVLPYYLHLLDKVAGAQHFEVREEKAISLIDALRKQLPGYLVPRLVREQQGKASKTIIR